MVEAAYLVDTLSTPASFPRKRESSDFHPKSLDPRFRGDDYDLLPIHDSP